MEVDAIIIRRSPVVVIFRLICILMLVLLGWITLIFILRSTYGGSAEDIFQLDIFILVLYTLFASGLSLITLLRWAFEEYTVYENEIVHSKGVIFRHQDHISLRNVASIAVDQRFFGRVLQYGTILIHSPLIKGDIKLRNVSDPIMQVPILESAIGKKSDRIVPVVQ